MKKWISLLLTLVCMGSISALPAGALSAEAAAVINGDTGEVIFAHNADTPLPMASTTKIMTAMLLCEHGDLDTEITVTADMLRVEGSSMGLLAGDRVTYHDLLYGMLLASGNDAANVTAMALGGSTEGFAAMMNARAAELGLSQTHFVTPSGLDAEGHCTTARELALLAQAAMQQEEFAKAASSESATLCYGNPPYQRRLSNHNRLLKTFDGAIGVKTGFTKKSGRCLVSAAKRDGKYVIAVTLHDPNDWSDHAALLEQGLASIQQTRFTPPVSSYTLPVIGGQTERLTVSIDPITVNTVETAEIVCTVCLPKFLYAPLKTGEVIGSVTYQRGDLFLGKTDLTVNQDIAAQHEKKTRSEAISEAIKTIWHTLWEK